MSAGTDPQASGPLCDTLVLAAHPMELAPLATWLDSAEAPPGLDQRVTLAITGVGLGEAGAGAARAIERHQPRKVVLVGSAGVYPGISFPLGSLLLARDAHLVSGDVVAGRAAIPEAMQRVPVADAELSDGLAAVAPVAGRVSVATTLAITTDDALARDMAGAGPWEVENLEAFAVAHACELQGAAFAALLVATNEVGAKGRDQWRSQAPVAAEQTAKVLARWLSG